MSVIITFDGGALYFGECRGGGGEDEARSYEDEDAKRVSKNPCPAIINSCERVLRAIERKFYRMEFLGDRHSVLERIYDLIFSVLLLLLFGYFGRCMRD